MDLHLLRTFAAVADEGRLTRAAERLHLSQPAVSAHVKALEEELGLALFTRTARGMEPTQAGAELLPLARGVLDAADGLKRRAGELTGTLAGTVRVGCNTDPAFLRVPELVEAMKREHPRVRFHFYQGLSGSVLLDVKAARLDAGFIFGDNPHPEIEAVALGETRLCIVAPAAWAGRIKDAQWADLAALPWVLTPPLCPYRQFVDRTFAERGAPAPSEVTVCDLEGTARSLVRSGEGLSVLKQREAEQARDAGEVCIWPGEAIAIRLWFAYAAKRRADPLLAAVLRAVGAVWDADTDGAA